MHGVDDLSDDDLARLDRALYVNRNGRSVPLNLPDDRYNPEAVTPEEGDRLYAVRAAVFQQLLSAPPEKSEVVLQYPEGISPDEARMWCRALFWKTESGELVPCFIELASAPGFVLNRACLDAMARALERLRRA